MSDRKHTLRVRCDDCQKVWETETWTMIDEDLDQEAVQMVCDDLFFIHQCPNCGKMFKFTEPVVYFNKDNKAMICFVDGLVNAEMAKMFMSDVIKELNVDLSKFNVRLTTSMNEFREKVLLLKDGLDDRTVEILKILSLETVRKEGYKQTFREIRCSLNPENGKLAIDFCGDLPRNMQINRTLYDQAFREMLPIFNEHETPLEVNADWAINFLENYNS